MTPAHSRRLIQLAQKRRNGWVAEAAIARERSQMPTGYLLGVYIDQFTIRGTK